MRHLKSTQTSHAMQDQPHTVAHQTFKTPDMLNHHHFNSQHNAELFSKDLPQLVQENSFPGIQPMQQEDYSNNVLNMGFICDQSHLSLSESQSVMSQGISVISVIGANPKEPANIHNFYELEISGISGMQEWPQAQNASFSKKNIKKSISKMKGEDYKEIQNQFIKRNMAKQSKVLNSYQSTTLIPSSGYNLRSKSKHFSIEEEDSSYCQTIRSILGNISKQEKGRNQSNSKTNQKISK